MHSETSCTTDSSGDEQYSKHGKKYFEKRKIQGFVTRPNASSGFWLCCLLPLALASVYVKTPKCKLSRQYAEFLLAAIGMCIQSLCFFAYATLQLGLSLDLCISCLPVIFTALLYKSLFLYNWWWAAFCGLSITYGYQQIYVRVMKQLPRCFSYGECAIFVQGLVLFLVSASRQALRICTGELIYQQYDIFQELRAIMLFALTSLYIMSILIYGLKFLRTTKGFYFLLALVVVVICSAPITRPLPLLKVMDFVLNSKTRRNTVIFYAFLVALTVLTVWLQLRRGGKASTRMRKMFHLLIVLVYVPGILFECAFLYLATGVAFALFSVLELIRINNIPPLANTLKTAFASFSDDKDAGLLALTPFCLLMGCSLPLWINPCACSAIDTEAYIDALLPQFAGILAVGVGDTAASVIGSKFGKRKWKESSRSVEGTVAFIVFVFLSVFALFVAGYIPMTQGKWFVTIQAIIITALVEAHTDQIDNLVLPLVFYTIVNLG